MLRRQLPAGARELIREDRLIALHAGSVSDVARIYFDQTLVLEIGQLEPYKPGYRSFTRVVQSDPGVQTISIAISSREFPLHLSTSDLFIGDPAVIFARDIRMELVSVGFIAIYLSIGCYHLLLAMYRLRDLYNLYFGLFSILLTIYYLVQTSFFQDFASDHVLVRERLFHSVFFLLGPPLVFFLTDYFHDQLSRFGLVCLLVHGILSVLVWFSTFSQIRALRDIWHLTAIPLMLYIAFYVFRELIRGRRDAVFMAPGLFLLMATGVHDILVNRGILFSPNGMSKYSFLILNCGLAVILANRFMRLHREVEVLNQDLENKVTERTRELDSVVTALQQKESRVSHELDLAREIQLGILPRIPIHWDDYWVDARYSSMMRVGGDFFDVIPLFDDRLALFVADVSGHGIPAALITTMAKISMTRALQESQNPREVLNIMNLEILAQITTPQYLTCFLMILSPDGYATYASGGHPPAILTRANGSVELLEASGAIIGAMSQAGSLIEERDTRIEVGDRLLIYTDGLVEARNSRKEEMSIATVTELLREYRSAPAYSLLDRLLRDLSEHTHGDAQDDTTLLLLERRQPRNS
ncbi:MAG: SpoIIE family protein phosphatase [Spirochaetia bacterium]|nr:SpoIIE family protein phosphatase [Spirochaetia bacterium]